MHIIWILLIIVSIITLCLFCIFISAVIKFHRVYKYSMKQYNNCPSDKIKNASLCLADYVVDLLGIDNALKLVDGKYIPTETEHQKINENQLTCGDKCYTY
jgi:hypothetical protein